MSGHRIERDILRWQDVASPPAADAPEPFLSWYIAINRHFFSNSLPSVRIRAVTFPDKRLADVDHLHSIPRIRIASHQSLKEQFYALLHELMHCHVTHTLRKGLKLHKDTKEAHSLPEWMAECHRIGMMLGCTGLFYEKGELGTFAQLNPGWFPHAFERYTGRDLPPIEQWLQ